MRGLERFISHTVILFGGAILCLMALLIVIDVFLRNVVGAGFPVTAELVAKYFMVAVSFLPVAYAELRRRHIEATIFTDYLPKSLMPVVFFFGFLLSAGAYGLLTWGSATDALSKTARGAYVEAGTMDFVTWPAYWIPVIGFGMMVLICVLRLITVLGGSFSDDPHDDVALMGPHDDEVI
ncbi:MAG: TRAP transporter small permease subunit [Neomegalonema sp.]|nr:TRAP transporter small permease subunit [Neomegalonema sp.]